MMLKQSKFKWELSDMCIHIWKNEGFNEEFIRLEQEKMKIKTK